MSDPFAVVRKFERAVAAYCGAPFAVAVNSCTSALFLSLMWFKSQGECLDDIECPSRTYVSVPMQILHAGGTVKFSDYDWTGMYQLAPLPIWDCARIFTSNMYSAGRFMCTSHHWSKTLGLQQGGCILHGDMAADIWLRKARFDGRTEGLSPSQDVFEFPGWHMYMSPEIAAQGLVRLHHLPEVNMPLRNDEYPDLSQMEVFSREKNRHGV